MAMLLRQSRFGFSFSFKDRLKLHLKPTLDGCEIGSLNLAAE